MDIWVLGVVIVIILAIAAVLIRGGGVGSSRKKDTLVLMGPLGTGKTLLFHQLRDGQRVDTHTSMKENVGTFIPQIEEKDGTELTVVDFPGHPRLRSRLYDYIPVSKGVVYVLDSTSKEKVKENAEMLYNLFTEKLYIQHAPPMLIFCNKQDIVTAVKADKAKLLLEQELDSLRKTRSSMLDQAEGSSEEYLGIEGQPFTLDQCAGEITLGDGTIKKGVPDPIVDFIKDL